MTPLHTPPPSSQAWRALAVLCLVYLLNFLDRTLIFILFPLLKKELVFSDLQLALLGSTSFVIFYTTLGLPFGRLSDRVSRKKLIAAGLAVWSLFSGLTGFCDHFWSLFLCRLMVGVGEATLGPAAMSLLSDLFPKQRRATAQSIYSAGIPLGAAAAFFLGSHIGAAWGWRTAFYGLGFPGLLLAGLVLTLPDPPRGQTEGLREAPRSPRALLGIGPLRWHVAGYALMAVAGNSLSMWVPSFLARAYTVPLPMIGNLSGGSMAISGGLATALGGAVADRWRRDQGPAGRMRFSAALALLCVPLWLGLALSGSVPVMFACFFGLAGAGLAWLGPAAADVHDLVGPELRGIGIAAYFLVVNVVGYGLAPPAMGALSDALGSAAQPLQMRWMLLICPLACLGAAALLARGGRAMAKASG